MNVHEVVRDAVRDANRNLHKVSHDPTEIARENRQVFDHLDAFGMSTDHSVLLQPFNGRKLMIEETVGDYRVQLFHPYTPAPNLQRELSGVRFQEETGQEIPPDLCIGLRDTKTGERSSYVASEDTVYVLPTPDRRIGDFVSNHGSSGTVVYARRASPTESLAVARIAQQATSIMLNNLRWVHKNTWRMQGAIDQGMAGDDLRDKEKVLWATYLNKEKTTPEPPETNSLFPGAIRFNYGWEWVAYLLPGDAGIAKVPRGIFPEVSKPEYLEYAQDAYLACMAEIPLFTTKSRFERREGTNIIYQPRLVGTPVQSIKREDLTTSQRSNYKDLGEGMLTMLDIHKWMPDLQLQRRGDGSWGIWDVIDVNSLPTLYDFTSVYDIFRLNPERTSEQVTKNRQIWQSFFEDMS